MKKSIFEGLKVADFTAAIAGPLATRYLAAEGATVIKVECHKHPDSVRLVPPYKDMEAGIDRSTQFAFYNYGKKSVALDVSQPQGREIAIRLIEWSDVLIENMAPGVMKKWELDYQNVKKIKPDIVYLSSSSLGRTGPFSGYGAWGYHHGPLVGFAHMIGWPDRLPNYDAIAYTDSVAPSFSLTSLIAALLYRRRTGKGCHIDQSQTEAGAYFLGPEILDYTTNGRVAQRNGNRDPHMVPHGIFPCAGEDKWVAMAVSRQEEWEAFCMVLNKQDWVEDDRFKTFAARKEYEDVLESLITNWTIRHTGEVIVELLQNAGIPSGIVANTEDLFADPQLKHRQHFQTVDHPEIGPHTIEIPSMHFSKVPHQPQKPAPLIGEHTDYVFRELLGYTDDEVADFLINGIITTDEDLPDVGSY